MSLQDYFRVIITAVIFNSEGKILLGKRDRNDNILPNYWGIPGGKVELKGDLQNILEKELKREVMEEVGIKITDLIYIESHYHKDSNKIHICFLAKWLSGRPKALHDTEEIGWFNLEEIKTLKLTPHTLDRINIAVKYLSQQK